MTNEKFKSFVDLEIWKSTHSLVLKIYKLAKSFPRNEKYILTNQLLRASQSMHANIAAGTGRYSKKEFLQYLIIARGSAEETKYHLILAKDLGYITQEVFQKLKNEYTLLEKKVNSLITSIRSKQ